MGWDTQITIIAENADEIYTQVAKDIFERDVKLYQHYTFRYTHGILCVSYERRKHLPHWLITEVSEMYPQVYFTAMGSCNEFVSGPAALIRVTGGEMIDSYGFFDEARVELTAQTDPDLLCAWFGKDGYEQQFRTRYITQYPLGWCEEEYLDKLIEFSPSENSMITSLSPSGIIWHDLQM